SSPPERRRYSAPSGVRPSRGLAAPRPPRATSAPAPPQESPVSRSPPAPPAGRRRRPQQHAWNASPGTWSTATSLRFHPARLLTPPLSRPPLPPPDRVVPAPAADASMPEMLRL